MSKIKLYEQPPTIEETVRDANEAHNATIAQILNDDFEKTHGYPHPSTKQKKLNIKEFEKAVDRAVRAVFEKEKAKKRLARGGKSD